MVSLMGTLNYLTSRSHFHIIFFIDDAFTNLQLLPETMKRHVLERPIPVVVVILRFVQISASQSAQRQLLQCISCRLKNMKISWPLYLSHFNRYWMLDIRYCISEHCMYNYGFNKFQIKAPGKTVCCTQISLTRGPYEGHGHHNVSYSCNDQ